MADETETRVVTVKTATLEHTKAGDAYVAVTDEATNDIIRCGLDKPGLELLAKVAEDEDGVYVRPLTGKSATVTYRVSRYTNQKTGRESTSRWMESARAASAKDKAEAAAAPSGGSKDKSIEAQVAVKIGCEAALKYGDDIDEFLRILPLAAETAYDTIGALQHKSPLAASVELAAAALEGKVVDGDEDIPFLN